MTGNKGPDSDLIFSLGIIFADGRALPLIAAVRGGWEAAASPPARERGAETKAPALGLSWCGGIPTGQQNLGFNEPRLCKV